MAEDSTVDAVIFNGGYGTDYVTFAADIMQDELPDGSTVEGVAVHQIAQELQPRFVGGNPPDLIDNSGANAIGFSTILDQLEDLGDVLDAPNLEGTTIRDTLFGGVEAPGTFDGKLAALNYVLTVYAVWYSASLFEENGWTPPKTWDEAIELGAKAKEAGQVPVPLGQGGGDLLPDAGHRLGDQGGRRRGPPRPREPRRRTAGRSPPCRASSRRWARSSTAGYMKPGGSGTQFTAAQAQWSNDQDALLYPSGSWIENEMKDQTKADFQMTGFPEMTRHRRLGDAVHRACTAPPASRSSIPSQAKNVAGGKELLRTMLSKEAATNFAKTKLAPTIVKGTVPADGFGSTALVSQTKMLDRRRRPTSSPGGSSTSTA